MSDSYKEPLALIVISSISLGLGGLAAAWIAFDIVFRRGWQSMMAIMIPVYVVNATYLWPITLWVYLRYGRPPTPFKAMKSSTGHAHTTHSVRGAQMVKPLSHCHKNQKSLHDEKRTSKGSASDDSMSATKHDHGLVHEEPSHCSATVEAPESGLEVSHHACHSSSAARPLFATVTIAVCHCGAGCVLGDIVGEWLVYGSGVMIGNPPRMLWPAYLIDTAFALAFGILFQYFSIAPMANDYSPKVLIRAMKADILSLLFFEIGLFAWMAIFQIAIFGWRLDTNTMTFWWMMQIGMFLGHWTGVPINYWLIKVGIKEPCA